MKPRIAIWATGGEEPGEGASGARKVLEFWKNGYLTAGDPVVLLSRYPNGGTKSVADDFGVKFRHFPKPYSAEHYRQVGEEENITFHMLSGHLNMVHGLLMHRVANIHPGLLPQTARLHGNQVHQRTMELYDAGELTHSAVSMHFVPDNGEYDCGPVFFEYPVPIYPDDTPKSLGKRVNTVEHAWQPFITQLVVSGQICCGGGETVPEIIVPSWYPFMPRRAA